MFPSVVDAKLTDCPCDQAGLPLGLLLSHIEGQAVEGDATEEYMSGKRQVRSLKKIIFR